VLRRQQTGDSGTHAPLNARKKLVGEAEEPSSSIFFSSLLKSKNKDDYGATINQINALLNGKSSLTANALGALGSLVGTDKAYAQVLGGVRQSLGHDIDFANQKDREAIGNALVKHVRETGGCDVAGNKANGCGH